jgi:DNA-3-methyladenine glycosylase II
MSTSAANYKKADVARRRQTRAALRHLSAADSRLATLIRRIGPYTPKLTPDPFHALVGSIVHQQVSMAAARAIRLRLAALCPRRRITPRALLALSVDELRSAGVSRPKARYLRGLADAFATRRLTPAGLRAGSDEEVIAAVTELPGVGRWTAEMLLIFCLERPDVWPVDDLGLRTAVQRLLGLKTSPRPREILSVADPWRPYRSVATWYLWRSLDGPVEPAIGA